MSRRRRPKRPLNNWQRKPSSGDRLLEAAVAARIGAQAGSDPSQEAKPNPDVKVAALPAPQMSAPTPPPTPPSKAELAKSVQAELRRVGCFSGPADGDWDSASRRSLELFNKNAGTTLDAKAASTEALDAIRPKSARVCPLVCGSGQKRDGDQCVKITCAAGYFLNNSDECEKQKARQAPSARVERRSRDREEAPVRPARPPKAEANSGGSGGGGGPSFHAVLPALKYLQPRACPFR